VTSPVAYHGASLAVPLTTSCWCCPRLAATGATVQQPLRKTWNRPEGQAGLSTQTSSLDPKSTCRQDGRFHIAGWPFVSPSSFNSPASLKEWLFESLCFVPCALRLSSLEARRYCSGVQRGAYCSLSLYFHYKVHSFRSTVEQSPESHLIYTTLSHCFSTHHG
jgi:hypothetical protein